MLFKEFVTYLRSGLIGLSFLLLPLALQGQTKSYMTKAYGVQDGLSSSAVYDIMQSKDGYIWFGTDAGVSKFDGYEFKNFTQKDGLTDNTVFQLIEDPKGRIWFLPFNGQIGYIQDDKVHEFPYAEKMNQFLQEQDWISSLRFNYNDRIEFSSHAGVHGFVGLNGDIDIEKSERTKNRHMIIQEGKEKLNSYWLAGDTQVTDGFFEAMVFDDELGTIDTLELNKQGVFLTYYNDENGLAFSYNNTIFRRSKDKMIHFKQYETPDLMKINASGETWVSYRYKGVYVYPSFEAFVAGDKPQMKLLENINVSDILFSSEGSVWLSTEHHGVFYIFNRSMVNYTFASKNQSRITALDKNSRGEVFFGNEAGSVYRIDTLEDITEIIGGLSQINCISFLDTSQIHLAYAGLIIDPVIYDDQFKPKLHLGRNVTITRSQVIWTLDYAMVSAVKKGTTLFSPQKSTSFSFFYCAYEDFEGNTWFGTKSGLHRLTNNQISQQNEVFGDVPVPKIRDIVQWEDSTFLLSTQHGVYRSNHNNGTLQFELVGLSGYVVKKIVVDDNNDVWVCTNNGLFYVQVVEGEIVHVYNIGSKVGMPSDEVNEVVFVGDEVFVATNAGVARFKKNYIFRDKLLPILHVTAIKVNEEVIDRTAKEDYLFKYDRNYIQFDYVGLNYRSLGDVNYSYRLDGIDESWQFSKSRSVRYPSLSPGSYCFRLRVANEDNEWGNEKKVFFQIELPFWRKPLFILLIAIVIITIAVLISLNIRSNRNKKFMRTREIEIEKRKVIEAELKALRAQMNPHFTFNTLNSIQNSINNFDQKNAMKYITNYSILLRKVLENSRHLYITIAEEVEMLNLYLGLENLRFDNTIDYVFDIDDEIDQHFHEIPSMIIQPMVENAIVHGLSGKREGEKKLRIILNLNGDKIICTVEDSGIGREKSAEIGKMKKLLRKSLGMQITKERLELFYKEKGDDLTFKVTDLYDDKGQARGTRVKIIFKTKKQSGK